jgi:hypothetical protein
MPWVKLHSRLDSAPTIRRVGLEATGSAMGLIYCAQHGMAQIPSSWIREQPRARRALKKLVEHGLWRQLPSGSFEPVLEERGLPPVEINYSIRERIPRWLRRLIFARDGGVCQLCDQPVVGPFPRSLGGERVESNLQLAHPFCNIRKGNRV